MWKQVAILFFLGWKYWQHRDLQSDPSCGFSTRKKWSQPLSRTIWKEGFRFWTSEKKRIQKSRVFLNIPMNFWCIPLLKKDHDFQPALCYRRVVFPFRIWLESQSISAALFRRDGQPPRINLRVSKRVIFLRETVQYLSIADRNFWGYLWISQIWSISLVFFGKVRSQQTHPDSKKSLESRHRASWMSRRAIPVHWCSTTLDSVP